MSNEVAVTVVGRDRLSPELAKAQQNAEGFGASLKRVGEVAAGVFAAQVIGAGLQKVQGFISDGITAAANLEQSIGGVESVFKENADVILAWGQNAHDAAGLSKNAFNELATPLGAMLKNAGFGMKDVTDTTIDLTQRAADMAATFGGPVSEAMTAITAALRGETDPIERYGVSLRAVDVQARALADTGKQSVNDLTPMEMQQARLALLFEQTADAQGQFAREADTAAGKQERLQAAQENAAASLGEKLLPAQVKVTEAKLAFVNFLAEKVIPALGQLTEWIGDHVVPVLSAFGSMVSDVVVAKVLPLLQQLGERAQAEFAKFKDYYESDVKPAFDNIQRAVEWLVGEIEERWPQIERVIRPVLEQVQEIVEFVFTTVQNTIATVLDLIQGDWEGAWNNIKEILSGAVTFIEETLNNILTFIGELATLLFDAAKDLGGKIVDGIVAGIKALGGAIGQALLDVIPDSVPLPGPLPDIPLPSIPGLASGGTGSGLRWVGEAGPELVNFGSPSRVFNAQDSRALARGGGGSVLVRVDGAAALDFLRQFIHVELVDATAQAAGRGRYGA